MYILLRGHTRAFHNMTYTRAYMKTHNNYSFSYALNTIEIIEYKLNNKELINNRLLNY